MEFKNSFYFREDEMKRFFCILMLMLLAIMLGCSGSGTNPALPGEPGGLDVQSAQSGHAALGFWQMIADPDSGTLDVVELRGVALHLNALRFLEPPPNLYLTIESPPEFSGSMLDVDIGLRHPFLGLTQFTGFDVCGILISQGSITGYDDPDIVVPGDGDTRLVNADGLTRWWNPVEFPYNTTAPIYGYIDGAMGTPDSIADYSATLNGFKYYADDLDIYDSPFSIDPESRGYFSAGQKNVRHYTIEMVGGLIFNYAVDASWASTGLPPYQIEVPDSFSEAANRPEAFFISTDVVENTLWYDGGSYGGQLSLDVYVYDWFDADMNTVVAECPGVFIAASSSTAIDGGANYSVYNVDLTSPILTSTDDIQLLIGAECESIGYQDKLPGTPVAAYAPLFPVEVSGEEPSQLTLIAHDEGLITNDGYVDNDDHDPALTIDGEGRMWIGYSWWNQDDIDHWWNYVRYNESTDNGLTFGPYQYGAWHAHGISPELRKCDNSKFAISENGQAFHRYNAPCGHTISCIPDFDPYQESHCFGGTPMEHAGEMLYTSEGYPMMFGDKDGIIKMRRGDYPNQGGTGTWPTFQGTQCIEIDDAWLSIVRSTGKTSDGICHLAYWKEGVDGPIRMLSSDDTSGTSWTTESIIQDGLAEIWVGAHDPSLWIDENDHFHVAYAGDTWMEEAWLVYAYSENGIDWTNDVIGNAVTFPDLELHDTGIITFNAFDTQWIFIAYEYEGEVWFQYKSSDASEFSEPTKVNVHENATLPDLHPNGDVGLVFAYEADGDNDNRDIFYRMYEFVQ